MRNNKPELWTRFFLWSILCSVIGLIISLLILIAFALFTYYFSETVNGLNLYSSTALLIGGYCSGYFCGLFRRTKGLSEGIMCGVFMYLIIIFIGGIALHSVLAVLSIKKFLLCTISSAIGGVVGVNKKRPKRI